MTEELVAIWLGIGWLALTGGIAWWIALRAYRRRHRIRNDRVILRYVIAGLVFATGLSGFYGVTQYANHNEAPPGQTNDGLAPPPAMPPAT